MPCLQIPRNDLWEGMFLPNGIPCIFECVHVVICIFWIDRLIYRKTISTRELQPFVSFSFGIDTREDGHQYGEKDAKHGKVLCLHIPGKGLIGLSMLKKIHHGDFFDLSGIFPDHRNPCFIQ